MKLEDINTQFLENIEKLYGVETKIAFLKIAEANETTTNLITFLDQALQLTWSYKFPVPGHKVVDRDLATCQSK